VFIHHNGTREDKPEHLNIQETKKWLRAEPESLGFEEVWEDIAELISARATFEGLFDKSEFSVEIVNGTEPGVQIHTQSDSFLVHKGSLQEVWQQLRSAGFVSSSSLVEGLDNRANHVMALFADLPYVGITRIAQYRSGRQQEYQDALQFIPRP